MRYHLLVALLKALGVYWGIVALAEIGPVISQAQIYANLGPNHPMGSYAIYNFTALAAHAVACPVLIFAPSFIARLCRERKPAVSCQFSPLMS